MAPQGLRTLSRSASFHLLSSDTTESHLGKQCHCHPRSGDPENRSGVWGQRNKLFREHDIGAPSILVSFPVSRIKPSDKGNVRRVCLRAWLKTPSVMAEKTGQWELDTGGIH